MINRRARLHLTGYPATELIDSLTGERPAIWDADTWTVECFLADLEERREPYDFTGIEDLWLEVKETRDATMLLLGPVEPDGAETPGGPFTECAWDEWDECDEEDQGEHCTFSLPAVNLNVAAGVKKVWLSIRATLTTGELVTFGAGYISVVFHGAGDSVEPPEPRELYTLLTEHDALEVRVDAIEAGAVGGGAPASASYLVAFASAFLTDERVLTAGSGITITDGGPGGALTIAASGVGAHTHVSADITDASASPVAGRVVKYGANGQLSGSSNTVGAAVEGAGTTYGGQFDGNSIGVYASSVNGIGLKAESNAGGSIAQFSDGGAEVIRLAIRRSDGALSFNNGAVIVTAPAASGQMVTAAAVAASYQPLDTDLTAIAALTTTTYGRSMLTLADEAAGRTLLALGPLATVALPAPTNSSLFLDGTGVFSDPQGGMAGGFFRFAVATAAADPGPGNLRLNAATWAAATAIYLDQLSDPGTDVTAWMELLRAGDTIAIQSKADSTKRARYSVTGVPTNNTGWFTIPVVVVTSAGTMPAGGAQVAVIVDYDGGGGATYQPLDADLTAIAALTGTNTIYYRSAANTWSAVTVSTGLSFTGGVLTATGGAAGAPSDATYLTLGTNATLTGERVLTAGANITLSDGGANGAATIALDSVYSAGVTTALAGKQPLDDDLTALAALTGTNTIYYRSGAGAWSAVTVSTGLSFTGGVLTATVPPGGSATQVQYNSGSALAGSGNLTWNNTAKTLTVCTNTHISETVTNTSPVFGRNAKAHASSAGVIERVASGLALGVYVDASGVYGFGDTSVGSAGDVLLSNADNSKQLFRASPTGFLAFGPWNGDNDARTSIFYKADNFSAIILKSLGDSTDMNMEGTALLRHAKNYGATGGYAGTMQVYAEAQDSTYSGAIIGDSAFQGAVPPYAAGPSSVPTGNVCVEVGPCYPESLRARFNYDGEMQVGRRVTRSIDSAPGVTQSGTTVTAAEGAFTSADVGRYIEWSNYTGGGLARHCDRIEAILSGTTVTVAMARTIATAHPVQIVEFTHRLQPLTGLTGRLALGKQTIENDGTYFFFRNTTSATASTGLYVFSQFVDAGNFEVTGLRLSNPSYGDNTTLLVDAAGTGTFRGLTVGTVGAAALNFATAGSWRFNITSAGHLVAFDDATYDIGAAGANRPRNAYLSGTVTAGNFAGNLSGCTVDGTNAVGYRNVPKNAKTGSYTLLATDVGKVVPNTTGGWTVNNSVHAAGDVILLYNDSASSQNITAGTITTMRLAGSATTGTRALAARGLATLYFQTASECIVSGPGVT